jgi:hypothetical protein
MIQLESGGYARDGPLVQMVDRNSAQLYCPFENRLPVEKNHTDMAKFPTAADPTYQTVVKNIKELLGTQ